MLTVPGGPTRDAVATRAFVALAFGLRVAAAVGVAAAEALGRALADGLAAARGTAPRGVRRVVDRGLAVDQGARFPSLGAMVDALERADVEHELVVYPGDRHARKLQPDVWPGTLAFLQEHLEP
jgi:hypothetical protein